MSYRKERIQDLKREKSELASEIHGIESHLEDLKSRLWHLDQDINELVAEEEDEKAEQERKRRSAAIFDSEPPSWTSAKMGGAQ